LILDETKTRSLGSWRRLRRGCVYLERQPTPQPLAFLDNYPLESLTAFEGDATASPQLLCRIYAIKGPVEAVRSRMDQEAESHGMAYILDNSDRTWMKLDRTLSVRLTAKTPPELSQPGPPGTTGYVVAYEPERISVMDHVWRAWLRFRYPS